MGTGVGGVDKKEAAQVMVSEANEFLEENKDFRIILVAVDYELYSCFERELSQDYMI